MLRVGDKPLQLLRAVRGLDLVDLPDAEVCCGFGGTFAVKNAETSTAMLADKMGNVLASKAEVCTAGDSSCLMHIGGGLSRLRAGVKTVHLAEILASTDGDDRSADVIVEDAAVGLSTQRTGEAAGQAHGPAGARDQGVRA
jgi:L-lactate dehydrogenase complex protein LldE